MTDNWRPEGWENPFSTIYGFNKEREEIFGFIEGKRLRMVAYEAGADAMLKGLREKGEHFTKEQIAKLLDPAKEPDDWDLPGTYVFIPDDRG